MRSAFVRSLSVFALAVLPSIALAGAPVLDRAQTLNVDDVYKDAQDIGSPMVSHAVYGKLTGQPAVDVYTFTATEDGSQRITLLGPAAQAGKRSLVSVLVDPTSETEANPINLPVPDDSYHLSLINQEAAGKTYTERALGQRYVVAAEQQLTLKKDTKYYLIIAEEQGRDGSYVVKFGDYQAWTASDVFTSFPAWLNIQLDRYGGASPFVFSTRSLGVVLLLLGASLLIGTFFLQEAISLWANRSKPAGYLFIKLQPFTRLTTWAGLWFTLLGGIVAFAQVGLSGLPFVLLLLWIVITAVSFYQTLALSPKILALEVTKREAAVPLNIRKVWFIASVVNLFALGAFVTFLGMAVTSALS